jgi:hypothetical protein
VPDIAEPRAGAAAELRSRRPEMAKGGEAAASHATGLGAGCRAVRADQAVMSIAFLLMAWETVRRQSRPTTVIGADPMPRLTP